MTMLRDIMNIRDLEHEIEAGFVRISSDEANPLHKILSYTLQTQLSAHWNRVTRNCRGLHILMDEDRYTLDGASVIDRGIPKFFCVDQTRANGDSIEIALIDDDEGVSEPDIVSLPLSSPAHVADKLDGAMCVGYVQNGRLRVHTKGNFASEEAKFANRILNDMCDTRAAAAWLKTHEPGATPIFEVVTPLVLHVVNYGTTETLFFLGWVNNASGTWRPAQADEPFAHAFGFPMPETLCDKTLADALALPERKGAEGIVITTEDACRGQVLLKLKYPTFLATRKKRYSAFSEKRIIKTAENLLVETADWVRPLDSADDTRLALSGLKPKITCSPENTPDHILDAAINAAIPLMKAASEDFRDHLATIAYAWGVANGYRIMRESPERAFVRAVLEHVPKERHNEVFATKWLYLACTQSGDAAHAQREIAKIAAHGATERAVKARDAADRDT